MVTPAVVRMRTVGVAKSGEGALPSPLMRRPQPAFGLIAVMSSLLVALMLTAPAGATFAPAEPAPAPVLAAASDTCTKWRGEYSPPTRIRVLRTWKTKPADEVKGKVVTVPFDEYVATVMAAEWPEYYPLETLKAGAIATKQFAWYYILHPRGGTKWVDGQQVCYDVVDNTNDQWYRPEKFGPGTDRWPAEGSAIRAAMDATWGLSLRKINWRTAASRFFLTGYRDGSSSAACGEDATGWRLYHNSTRKCGEAGWTFRQIVRKYLGPNVEIVDPGAWNVIGSKHGDVRMVEIKANVRVPRVWTPGRRPPEPGSHMGITLGDANLVAMTTGDMDGDGRDDLVWLNDDDGTARLKVALSDGVDYRAPEIWWAGDATVPLAGARLLTGDFHADGREDVAIVGRGPGGTTRMSVLRRKPYGAANAFADPEVWWQGVEAYDQVVSIWTADLSGDGRSDIVVRQHPPAGGVRVKTGVTVAGAPAGSKIQNYRGRWYAKGAKPAKVRIAVGDANRDGRADVVALVAAKGGAQVWRLQGKGLGGLTPYRLWTFPKSDQVAVKSTRMELSDIDFDGMADVILFSAEDTRTRVRTYRTRYGKLVRGPSWSVSLPWTKFRLY